MRSFDGTEQTQRDLHTGGDRKGLGMNSHPHSPQSNSEWQVCINNVTLSPASAKKTSQAWELWENKQRHFNILSALYTQHHVFQQVEEEHKVPFFSLFTHYQKLPCKDTAIINYQSTTKQTKTTLSPPPGHPYGSGHNTCRKTATIPHSITKGNVKPEVFTRLQGED